MIPFFCIQLSCDTINTIQTSVENSEKIIIKRISPSCCGACGILLIFENQHQFQTQLQLECDLEFLCCRSCGYFTKKYLIDHKLNKIIKEYLPVFDTVGLSSQFPSLYNRLISQKNNNNTIGEIFPLNKEDSFLIRKALTLDSSICRDKDYVKFITGFIESLRIEPMKK